MPIQSPASAINIGISSSLPVVAGSAVRMGCLLNEDPDSGE